MNQIGTEFLVIYEPMEAACTMCSRPVSCTCMITHLQISVGRFFLSIVQKCVCLLHHQKYTELFKDINDQRIKKKNTHKEKKTDNEIRHKNKKVIKKIVLYMYTQSIKSLLVEKVKYIYKKEGCFIACNNTNVQVYRQYMTGQKM